MEFKTLYICKSWDGKELSGDIEFESINGKISLKLSQDMIIKMFELCSDHLVESSKSVSALLTKEALESIRRNKEKDNEK